jgi:hypothetical protein
VQESAYPRADSRAFDLYIKINHQIAHRETAYPVRLELTRIRRAPASSLGARSRTRAAPPLVQKVHTGKSSGVDRLREGDMAPLEFLTGSIMKRTERTRDQIMSNLLRKVARQRHLRTRDGGTHGSFATGEIPAGVGKYCERCFHEHRRVTSVSIPFRPIVS